MNPVTDDTVIDIANRWPRPVPNAPKPAPRQRVDGVAMFSRIVRTGVELLGWLILLAMFLQWTW